MCPEVIHRAGEAVAQRDRRLTVKLRLRQGDVRAAADRVILWKQLENDLGLRAGELLDHRRQLEDRELAGVAKVHRRDQLVLVHHRDHPGDEVVHVAEGGHRRGRREVPVLDPRQVALKLSETRLVGSRPA